MVIVESRLRILKISVLFICMILASCAINKETTSKPGDYVEIDNPYATMTPDAPAKISVPRSYVESGPPRGTEVVKMGAEKVVKGIRGSSPEEQQAAHATGQQAPTATAPSQATGATPYPPPSGVDRQNMAAVPPQPYGYGAPLPAGGAATVRNRIALLEIGREGLLQPLYDSLKRSSIVGILDPGQSAYLAQSATLTNEAEKAAFANRLQQDYGVNVVVYLSAPDGIASGKEISAEVYDALAGGLLQKFDGVIGQEPVKDQSDRGTAVLPAAFTEKIRDFLALLPWYARITAVEGNRAYIAAGREAGLRSGQVLKIYQNGRFMKGMGFAPGDQVGTLVIQGFVGPNGSFGAIKDGQGIRATDLVSVE